MASTAAQFRAIALAFEGTEERAHVGHPDFRVGGKVFATLGYPDERYGMVKLSPEEQHVFCARHPKAFMPVKGAWGAKGATNVLLRAATKAALTEALEAAWMRNSPPDKRTATVRAWIEAMPGAQGRPLAPGKSSAPLVIIYNVMGKMFAILSVRGVKDVILKCDEALASALRKEYEGIGHRSHLDRRFWISVRLDADVPMKEVRRLLALSYELVVAGLSEKQRSELSRLGTGR
jgi:predicted DNA-binding protein (MmcQ/YjbR family)